MAFFLSLCEGCLETFHAEKELRIVSGYPMRSDVAFFLFLVEGCLETLNAEKESDHKKTGSGFFGVECFFSQLIHVFRYGHGNGYGYGRYDAPAADARYDAGNAGRI